MRTACLLACVLAAAPAGAAPLRLGGATMGTTWAVVVARPPASVDAERLRAAIAETLARVDREASTWRADSELSRFNDAPSTAWMPVSAGLAAIVAEALRTSRLSGGALDPTVAPLVDLWGFGPRGGSPHRPADADLRAARAAVGWRHLAARAAPPALRKARPEIRVDVSAVAKGFAADRVAERLADFDATDVLVEIGGEVRTHGRNPDGRPWAVAVERPTDEPGAATMVLRVTDAGVATSGDYRNHVEEAGRRWGHVIDPRTGEPPANALAAVTVVADSAMRADALATALLVLGPAAGVDLARRDGIAALFVERDGAGFRTTTTAALEPYARR